MASHADQDSLDTQRMDEIKLKISKPWPPDDDNQTLPSIFDCTWPASSRHDRQAHYRSSGLSIHTIPRLAPSRSYPIPTSNASLNFLKMNHAFAAFDGGDTQPMDSQIYNEYAKTHVAPPDSYNGDSCPPETYREGDTGHVDLFSDLVDLHQDNETRNTTQVSYSEGVMSDSPFRTDPICHPTHYLPPQTPALGHKRRHDGGEAAATSATKTPGSAIATSGLFDNGTGVPTLSLSQAFSNTQELTSPQIDGARSDPLRPSPNINMRFDSDAAALSSPTKMMRSDASRAASEPRDTYMTIKESRETRYRQRKVELEQKLQRLKAHDGDEYEDELADEQRKAERKALERHIEQLAAKCNTSVGASGDGLRARRRKKPFGTTKSDTALFTPIHARAKQDVVEISDDAGLSDDSEDELVSEPPTLERPLVSQTNFQVPKSSSRRVRTSQENVNESPTTRASQEKVRLHNHNNSVGADDDVAVADSQPHRQSQQDSNQPPMNLPDPSSLDTRIAQSQIPALSAGRLARIEARTKQVLETSSVPLPPADSSQAIEGHDAGDPVIPSSPPLLAMHEHDGVDGDRQDEGEDVGAINDDFDKPDPGYDFDGGVDYIESSPGLDEHNDEAHANQKPEEMEECSSEIEDGFGKDEHRVGQPDDGEVMVTELQEEARQDEHLDDGETGELQVQQMTDLERIRMAIPDSDPEARDCLDMSQPETTARRPEKPDRTNSNDMTYSNETPLLFSTARTHNSGMQSPRKSQPTPTKSLAHPTPKSTRPFRLLTEIAADPSQHQEDLEDIEIQTDILDDDDKEFAEIMSAAGSSPFRPAKRIKTYSRRALRESPKKINRIPDASPTPKSPHFKSPNTATRTAEAQEEETVFTRPAVPKPGIFLPSPNKQAKTTRAKSLHERPPKTRRATDAAETPHAANKKGSAKSTKKTPASNSRKKETVRQKTKDEFAVMASQQAGPEPVDSVDSRPEEVNADTEEHNREVVAPERVLARFKGYTIAYYPATCISAFMTGRVHCKIRFDDGTEDTLEDWEVRRCHLRNGDLVKVDLPNMRTKNYVVRGVKDFMSAKNISDAVAEHDHPSTDVYGAKTVVLEVNRRESLPESTSRETIDVPVASVYLTSTMWPQFKDREYKPALSLRPGFNVRPQTPSTNFSAPGTPTTTTSRRQVLPTPGTSVQRQVATPCAANTTGLFAGMAFALTWHGDDREKTQVIKLITTNGGQVLESGFEVLFNSHGNANDKEGETPRGKSTPKSTSHNNSIGPMTPSTTKATSDTPPLVLTPYASSLSFVALISDRHSRRTKYIQALALYLPCLSHHWLSASLSRNALAPWSLYLLPAGESAVLGGAVRSRVIEPMYEAGSEEGRLTSVLERRKKLLEGTSVLLVVKQRSRGTAYAFLTRVMGARRVKRCTGVVEARKALMEGTGVASGPQEESQGWDWVYVDGGDVEGAVRAFEGADVVDAVPSAASRSKKRKRNSEAAVAADDAKGDAGIGVRVFDVGVDRKVKVVGDEFVVQSLILGALLE